MKGLLIKDLCLLRNQKRIVPVFLILTVWFTVMFKDGFAFPFLGMMSTILANSTLSYDELDRGEASLFSLPFSRGAYVTEKFVLTGLLLAAAMVLGLISTGARALFAHDVSPEDAWMSVAMTALVCAVFAGIMLPLRIRFTGDQGRIILYVVMGVGMLAVVGITRLLPNQAAAVSGFFTGLPKAALAGLLAAVCLAFVLGGYLLALHWIKKKEY